MKPQLLILSDIHGIPTAKPAWYKIIKDAFHTSFELHFISSLYLADITKDSSKESAHQIFLNGGIEKAVKALDKLIQGPVYALGLSIGGTILWRYASENPEYINYLWGISATRLRFEVQRPICPIQLFYGNEEQFIPPLEWFQSMNLDKNLIEGNHTFYNEKTMTHCIKQIAKAYIEKTL